MPLREMYSSKPGSPLTSLVDAISADATSMTLEDASVLPSAPNICVIGSDSNAEIVSYTSISGNVVSGMVRGLGDTTRSAWAANTSVARNITSYDHDTFIHNINELQTDIDTLSDEVDGKQDTLPAYDTAPTANSTNIVTSGGVKTAFDGLHKIYTSPSELGLSGTPTMVAVAEAMPEKSIGMFATYDLDISALTYNDEVNEVVIFRINDIRTFAIASRTYNSIDFRNAQLYYASYSITEHTFYGFKKVASDILYFYNQSTSVTSASTAEFCNISDSRITADTVVLNCEFTVPSAITSGVSWTTAAGYISLKGICTSSTCKVNIVLGQKGN